MKKSIIFLLLLLSTGISAQKVNLYVGAGTLLLVNNVNINLEYNAKVFKGGDKLNVKLGFGSYGYSTILGDRSGIDVSNLLGLQLVYLSGETNLVEFGYGVSFKIGGDGDSSKGGFLVPVHIGYRREHSSSILRAGVGYPDGLYVSIGFSL